MQNCGLKSPEGGKGRRKVTKEIQPRLIVAIYSSPLKDILDAERTVFSYLDGREGN